MKTKLPASVLMATLALAGLLPGGCEPDDPKIRQEVAELRAKVAELEKGAAATRQANTPVAPVSAAPATGSISRDTLRRNLESQMPALRAALTRAFPDYRVDPVNAAAISTPQDSDYLPYSSEVSFGLSKGQTVASFSIRIGADRAGNWQLPDIEDLAASVGNLASSGAMSPSSPSSGASGRGATMDNNVRQIQWDNSGSRAPVSGYSQPPPPPAGNNPPPRQPAGDAPFPVQDSRTIRFDD